MLSLWVAFRPDLASPQDEFGLTLGCFGITLGQLLLNFKKFRVFCRRLNRAIAFTKKSRDDWNTGIDAENRGAMLYAWTLATSGRKNTYIRRIDGFRPDRFATSQTRLYTSCFTLKTWAHSCAPNHETIIKPARKACSHNMDPRWTD